MSISRERKFSFRKAAELLGVTEAQFEKIVKSGKIKEDDSGLVDEVELYNWLEKLSEIRDRRYSDLVFATRSYELGLGFTRDHIEEEAREHFKKEWDAFVNSRLDAWKKIIEKDRAETRAKEEAEYAAQLKALGAPVPQNQEEWDELDERYKAAMRSLRTP